MKSKVLIALLLLSFQAVISQNAYYDAFKLRQLINESATPKKFKTDSASIATVGKILYNYLKFDQPVTQPNYDLIKSELTDPNGVNYNLFLKGYLPNTPNAGAENFTPTKSFLGAIGSTNVTNFADGLAKFLVKRAKQELLVSFFEKFPDLEKKYPEMKYIFPNTCELINNFDSWEYANIINTLREAFDKDLQEILTNLPKITTIDTTTLERCECDSAAYKRIVKYKTFFGNEKGMAISASLLIGGQFISGNKLPDVINNMTSQESMDKIHLSDSIKERNIKNAMKFLRVISNGLRSSDVTKNYVTNVEIDSLLNDGITRNIFLGLLYQQMIKADITLNGHKVSDFLNPSTSNGAATYIQNFVHQSMEVAEAVKKLNQDKAVAGADLKQDWGAIFQAVGNFIPVAANVEVIDLNIKLPDGIQLVVEKSKFAITVAHDIAIRNYSAAIVGLLKEMNNNSKDKDELKEFKAFFVKYGSFAANVSQAKNSDEVEEAIESVALPVGSASIKKKTAFNIALNAYLGGFYGGEYLATKEVGQRWSPISGVYAPVGVAFSLGFNGSKRNYGSLSALISVIDIGAVASYRLGDEKAKKLPEITLQNIFAPGLGLIYGIPEVPLSVGVSYQFGPALRKITETEATTDQINHRWQVFLAVDIPIFNLHSSVKREKEYKTKKI